MEINGRMEMMKSMDMDEEDGDEWRVKFRVRVRF